MGATQREQSEQCNYSNLDAPYRWYCRFMAGIITIALLSVPSLAQSQETFLPIISIPCGSIPQTAALQSLFVSDAGQRRRNMQCDRTLMQVAQARAEDMANRNYFDHITPEGVGPNRIAMQAGYAFPSGYSTTTTANQIESIYAGSTNASVAWTSWMGSSTHREHLLGLTTFYAAQHEYGIGYAYNPNSRFKHFWVIVTGEPAVVAD